VSFGSWCAWRIAPPTDVSEGSLTRCPSCRVSSIVIRGATSVGVIRQTHDACLPALPVPYLWYLVCGAHHRAHPRPRPPRHRPPVTRAVPPTPPVHRLRHLPRVPSYLLRPPPRRHLRRHSRMPTPSPSSTRHRSAQPSPLHGRRCRGTHSSHTTDTGIAISIVHQSTHQRTYLLTGFSAFTTSALLRLQAQIWRREIRWPLWRSSC
jgi:hypothetical protein